LIGVDNNSKTGEEPLLINHGWNQRKTS